MIHHQSAITLTMPDCKTVHHNGRPSQFAFKCIHPIFFHGEALDEAWHFPFFIMGCTEISSQNTSPVMVKKSSTIRIITKKALNLFNPWSLCPGTGKPPEFKHPTPRHHTSTTEWHTRSCQGCLSWIQCTSKFLSYAIRPYWLLIHYHSLLSCNMLFKSKWLKYHQHVENILQSNKW